jgi:hypothetical protein
MNNLAPRSNTTRQSGRPGSAVPNQIDGPLQVERLMALAFFLGLAPRSAEYRQGCQAALDYRILGLRMHLPYPAGCSEADAWFAGTEEGQGIWQRKGEVAAMPAGCVVPS